MMRTGASGILAAMFGALPSRRRPGHDRAFTLLELLIVISIIIILAGITISTMGYVQVKGARSRAEAEIAAMSASLESYKADNGAYPTDPGTTESVDPSASPVPASASLFLYKQLSGDVSANLQPPATAKVYFAFKPNMLSGAKDASGNLTSVTYIMDPFSQPYGYSTMKASGGAKGYNPTFDLWSTAGDITNTQSKWIKNW
jgi:general secretion pathway protein G